MARGQFDVRFHAPFGGLAADVQGQVEGAQFVDFVVLAVACFAAAIEDVVELGIVGEVEDSGQGLRAGGVSLEEVGGLAGRQVFGGQEGELGELFVDYAEGAG